ncbi:MAG: hypothetical protein JNL67_21685 [Planctomycetaceae bacterium]|nr:hypothetical protein [Planctomycetaceae bacterium]
MPVENLDPKPSGAAFQSPIDFSFEANLVGIKLIGGVYASLHPLSIVFAALALLIVDGIESLWPISPAEIVRSSDMTDPVADQGPLSLTPASSLWPSRVGPLNVAAELMQPWVGSDGSHWGRDLVMGLIGLLVWSWVGTLICRHSALALVRADHRWSATIRFTNQHYLDALFSFLIPLATVVVLSLPLVACGWLLVANLPSILGAPLAVFGAGFGLLIGVVLLGFVLGWPLMLPAIAFEGRDSFESISRAYAYILQRPLHSILVALAAIVIGSLAGYVVELFFSFSANGYLWALSWGANAGSPQRLAEILQPTESTDSAIVQYWTGPWLRTGLATFELLGRAATYAMFWGLASGSYLLLRRYLDQTPLDEIYRPGMAMLQPLEKQTD